MSKNQDLIIVNSCATIPRMSNPEIIPEGGAVDSTPEFDTQEWYAQYGILVQGIEPVAMTPGATDGEAPLASPLPAQQG